MPRRKVVGFLIDMNDFWSQVMNTSGKRREMIDMEVAVEADRLHEQTVALHIGPFQTQFATRIAPTRRSENPPFQTRQAPDFFWVGPTISHQPRLSIVKETAITFLLD